MNSDPNLPATISRRRFGAWHGAGVAMVLLLFSGGCVQVRNAATVGPDSFDTQRHSTFTFYPQAPDSMSSSDHKSPAARVRAEVVHTLRTKGYAEAPPDRASFYVSFYTNLAGPIDESSIHYSTAEWERASPQPVEIPPPTGDHDPSDWETGYFPDPAHYVEMIVVIDAIDRRTDTLLWRGWAREKAAPRALSADEIVEVVHAVLEEFPERPERAD